MNTSEQARVEFNQLKAQGVPTFVIDNQVIVGFDHKRIMDLLDYRVEKCPSCGAKMRVPKDKGKIRITCHECQHKFILTT